MNCVAVCWEACQPPVRVLLDSLRLSLALQCGTSRHFQRHEQELQEWTLAVKSCGPDILSWNMFNIRLNDLMNTWLKAAKRRESLNIHREQLLITCRVTRKRQKLGSNIITVFILHIFCFQRYSDPPRDWTSTTKTLTGEVLLCACSNLQHNLSCWNAVTESAFAFTRDQFKRQYPAALRGLGWSAVINTVFFNVITLNWR